MLRKLFSLIKNREELEEPIEIVPVPSLVAVLLNKEREKGSPLTEEEVIEIRDNVACIAMPVSVIPKLEEERGYIDIDPESAWEEWQLVRIQFFNNENL